MRKEFKKSYLVINIILSLAIFFFLLNIFVFKNTNFYFIGISTSIIFLILFFIFGYESRNRRYTYESAFYIFAYSVLYIIVSYIIGIFSGFNYSIYSFSVQNLLLNIVPYILIIVSGEFLRNEIARKGETSVLAYILIVFLLILVDCSIYLTSFDLATGDGMIKYICSIILPSVAKNILLVYISRIGGVKPTIVYRLIMELKMFIIPIAPDYGLYLESILATLYPTILGFVIYFSLKQYENKEVTGKTLVKSRLYVYLSVIITGLFLITIIVLSSCKFKYGAIAIGSGSMTGTINKGDVAIYKAIGENDPEVDDILVFKKDDRVIIHRIIEVVEISENEKVYYTKGDANPTPDGYPIQREDIIGTVKMKIKYVGMPSVYLNELLTKKK